MSNIEKLLEGVEVEWKTLGEVASINRGRRLIKKQLEKIGKYAVYQNCMIPLGYHHESNVEADTTFIICAGSAGEIGYSDVAFWAADDVYYFITKDDLQNKFLYYFLLTQQQKIYGQVRRSSVPRLSKTAFEKLQIPIPCPNNPKKSLEIQKEIVCILDKFSTLTATLTAELQARKSQYEYYRNQLLTYPMEVVDSPTQPLSTLNSHTGNSVLQPRGKVEWIPLDKVAKIKNGKDWKQLKEGNIPVYGSGGIMAYVNTFTYNKPTVLIPRKGSITNIFYVETPMWNVDTIYYTEIDTDIIVPKYFYYYLKTLDLMKLDTGSGRPSLTQAILNQIMIPIPYPNDTEKSLKEQERIVAILDKFDTITTSITEGLPKEIELRQKQYEYYRDMLLTFPTNNIKA